MKKHNLFWAGLILLCGCGTSKNADTMTGIYRLESSSRKNAKVDTLYANQNQIKIYTDSYFAYTNLVNDTTASFGFGRYEMKGDHLVEHNIYSTSVLDSSRSFDLDIDKKDQGYTQTIESIKIEGLDTRLVENYLTIPSAGNSPLDGCWKLKSFCKISGKDTICESRIQYKIFHKGFFMFVQNLQVKAGSNKMKGNFGFGNFDLSNKSLTETNLYTSYPALVDKQTKVEVTMMGKNEYSQIIRSDIDKSTVIETYEKLNTGE